MDTFRSYTSPLCDIKHADYTVTSLPSSHLCSKPTTMTSGFSVKGISNAFNSRGMIHAFPNPSRGPFSPSLVPSPGSISPLRNSKLLRGNWHSTNSNATRFSMGSMVDKPTTAASTEQLTTDQPFDCMYENHHQLVESHRSDNFPVVVSPSTPPSIPSSSISIPLTLSTPQRLVDTINSPSPSQYQLINDPNSNTMASQQSARQQNPNPSRNNTARSRSNNHGFNNNPNQTSSDQQHVSPSSVNVSVGTRNKPRVRGMIAEYDQKRKREEEWLETVLRQRNVLLVGTISILYMHPINSFHVHESNQDTSNRYNLSLQLITTIQGMSQCVSDEVKRNDLDDDQSMNMTMSLLLADDAESTHDVGVVATDGLLEITTSYLAEEIGEEVTQVLREGEADVHSTLYESSNSPLGASCQRPSAVDMTTIYPTAVDQYHQPTVLSSNASDNNNNNNNTNNNNGNTSGSAHGVDPQMTNVSMGPSDAHIPSRVITVLAKEVRTSPVSSSPARLIDRGGQVRVQVYPPTTATTTANNNNNNSDDVMMSNDEHTLREDVDTYQRQALQDQAIIQALKQERDALLSAASSAMTQSSSNVQTRDAQMFSPAGIWTPRTPNLNPRSRTNTPVLKTTPWNAPVLNSTPLNHSNVTSYDGPYDGPPIKSIQKVLIPTTISTVVTSNQYVQRIQELEEKLRFESEQTAVILSQRDTFAMSKSTLTAKLAGKCLPAGGCSLMP